MTKEEIIELVNSVGIADIDLQSSIGDFEDSTFGSFVELTLKDGRQVTLEQWFSMKPVKQDSGIAIYDGGNCSDYLEIEAAETDDSIENDAESFCQSENDEDEVCDVCTGACMLTDSNEV